VAPAGLGIFRAKVVRFTAQPGLKIPQIRLEFKSKSRSRSVRCFATFPRQPTFISCTVFFPKPADESIVAARTTYGERFASAIWKDNVFATQLQTDPLVFSG